MAGAVIVFRDVTATRLLEEKLAHTAQHDFLTGLPNRMLLEDRVSQAIAFARRNMCGVAALFLDLDGFKHVNDSLGHPIGDKLLQSVSTRLLDCVRGPDTVSRLGGDEFVVLLQELQHPEDAATTAGRVVEGSRGCSFDRATRDSRHDEHWGERLPQGRQRCGNSHQECGHRDVSRQEERAADIRVLQARDAFRSRSATIE